MKKKRAALVIAAVLAIAVISGLWYARPLTIEELCPRLDQEQWLEDVLDCILILEPNNNPQSD